MDSLKDFILLGVAGVCTVLWFFVRQRWSKQEQDFAEYKAKQSEETRLLWEMHHKDAGKLIDLELHIAKEHYLRGELDQRFNQLDTTFREGFKEMTREFRTLSEVLIKHIAEEAHK